MQPCHGAPPHPSAAGSSHFWMQYSGTPGAAPCGHARPCHVQVPVQLMGSAYGWPFAGSSLHTAAPYGQFAQPWTPPMQCQGCSGRHYAAEPAQKREPDIAYCLLDENGAPKPFSSVSGLSARYYDGMISKVFQSDGPWILHAVQLQRQKEREDLKASKGVIAEFLREKVGDRAGNSMSAKGIGEEQAEVDTVYNGSFKSFDKSIEALSEVKVRATCEQVEKVLLEICSDCRFVAMKLYQIEIQSCLVARKGYLVDKAQAFERQQLCPEKTGFAIIFNRAALQIDTKGLATQFNLRNVLQLLEEGKLHIAYFQPESAVPAALSIARDADKKAADADKKAAEAKNEVRELKEKLQGTVASTKAVWVRQLQKKDGSGGFEFVGNAFKITGAVADIDDLKKAIKRENPATVQCDAFQIEIFSRQEDGTWKKEDKMGKSLQDTDDEHPYGYTVP